jgi:hypothetical protein
MAALMTVGGLLAACSAAPAASPGASPTTTPPLQTPAASPSPSPSTTPALGAELVLRVTTEGGFIGPAAHLAQLPVVVVYADGRIFTPAPVDAIYPGPLLPVESVRTVGASGVGAIRAAIAAARLDAGGGTNPGSEPTPPTPSSPSRPTARSSRRASPPSARAAMARASPEAGRAARPTRSAGRRSPCWRA